MTAGARAGGSGVDVVRESAGAGRVVLFEESARDGAQAKTLMSAGFRVRLARAQGAVFGSDGPRHVVFAAGFPSVCGQEFEATRQVALEAQESVSPSAICRGTVEDVRLALSAVRGAAHGRVMVIVAASEATARALVHSDARTALDRGLDVVKEAVDRAGDTAVDVCLVDAPRADHALVAEFAGRMTAQGAATIVLADTVGDLLPGQTRDLFRRVAAGAGPDTVLVSHLHNDLGLGLANTLAALESGARVAACSWLGMAERSGMVATEQLLFLLAHDRAKASYVLGPDCEPWWSAPDLTRLPGIARMVAAETGVPLTVTTPIVGTGVATISTGTPFTHPGTFQPYDPERHLGLAPTVVLTHLASRRVLRTVAGRRTGQPPADTAARATAMFGPGIPVVDADALRRPGTSHAATTMLRIGAGGDLAHVRGGAQDRAHGPDPEAYLTHLRAAHGGG
ncbi:2-isopropylmalate synthase [Streptomyces sp. NBC_01298]|uniref:2-isopropylmalate synthase n=1 Tax=Streptomyces sp. NBC_01298 TaxID=2903817 RepID=UPI002E0FD554|nr:2-isopropylmalate synthase [Streptomyces sp. NBC_01298]